MNPPYPYDASPLSSSYHFQNASDAQPESIGAFTPIAGPRCVYVSILEYVSSLTAAVLFVMCTVCSIRPFPSLGPEAPRRSVEGYHDQYLSPHASVDPHSTRRASTSAIYNQASTPTFGSYVRTSRPVPSLPKCVHLAYARSLVCADSTRRIPLGRKRSASDSHFQVPHPAFGHHKSASTDTRPDPAFFGRYVGHSPGLSEILTHRRPCSALHSSHPYDVNERGRSDHGQHHWGTQYATRYILLSTSHLCEMSIPTDVESQLFCRYSSRDIFTIYFA